MQRLTLLTVVGISAIAASCAYALAASVTRLDDAFESPDATRLDDAGEALDVAFYGFDAAAPTVVDGALRVTPPAGGGRYATANFTPATLANLGDVVTLRFDFRGVRPAQSGLPEFNIGLYGSGGVAGATDDSTASRDAAADDRGILAHLYDSAGYSSVLQFDGSGRTLDGEFGAYIGQRTFVDGEWHSFEITIRRTTTGLLTALSQDGETPKTAQLTTQSPPLAYDNIQFGTGSTPFTFELDNLAVTYTAVPEPVAGVAGVAAAVAMLRRRRFGR